MKTPYRTPLSLLLCVAIECVFATEAPAQQTSASGPSSSSSQENQFTQLLLGPIQLQFGRPPGPLPNYPVFQPPGHDSGPPHGSASGP